MKPFEPLLQILLNNIFGIAILIGFFILIKFVASAKFKGWFGERIVQKAFQALDPATYQVHHDLYLPRPDGKGSTQIDHVVVSGYGIFVIETKNYKGWIFGDEHQAKWTQQIYQKKSRFQNPLHQNALHVRALAKALGLNEDRFNSIVFFIGDCTFKTPMPENVMNRGLSTYIRAQQVMKLTPPELDQAKSFLSHLDRTTNRSIASREHLADLKVRHGG